MKVILLCAGYATRLYPLTKERPKPLLPIADRPILEYTLEACRELDGLDDVIVVTNHKFAGHFEKWAKSFAYSVPITTVDDQTLSNEDRLGAIGDLNFALQSRKIGQEDLLVIAGDNLFDFDLGHFVEYGQSRNGHAAIACVDVKDKELAKQYGLLKLAPDGKVLEFLEKPQNPPTTLASCGLYWLPKETRVLLDRYIREAHNADQPGHYMRWLSEADILYGISLQGQWYDIGDIHSYNKADAAYRKNSI